MRHVVEAAADPSTIRLDLVTWVDELLRLDAEGECPERLSFLGLPDEEGLLFRLVGELPCLSLRLVMLEVLLLPPSDAHAEADEDVEGRRRDDLPDSFSSP